MKRTRIRSNKAQPDAIISADWHIRSTVPVCRTDNFLEAMWGKVKFILDLSEKYQCPIIIAGDIGHKSQWPNWLLEKFIDLCGTNHRILMTPGQHDLPNHLLSQWKRSAIGVLDKAGCIEVYAQNREDMLPCAFINLPEKDIGVRCFAYGQKIEKSRENIKVAMAHTLITEGKPDKFLEGKATGSIQLLKKFPEYRTIFSGDNHLPFVTEYEGRLHINPGSLLRTTAAQADHRPRVYLWYSESNTVEPVYLPIEEGVVDRSHIEAKDAKDERIEAYVTRLNEDVEVGLDFPKNIEEYFNLNNVRNSVVDKTWEHIPE